VWRFIGRSEFTAPVDWPVIRHMAAGQLKVFALRTYGVTDGAADRPSPDSSGSPQRCDAAAAIRRYWFEIQRLPVDFAPEREDYKRIAGSRHYKYC
jgi:hypothetical protein